MRGGFMGMARNWGKKETTFFGKGGQQSVQGKKERNQ